MGTEQKNLDVPIKVTGKTVYGIDVRVPGMKWAAVKACPVYGGDVKSYDFDAIRNMPGVRSAVQFPIPDPALTRGRIFSGGVAVDCRSPGIRRRPRSIGCRSSGTIPPEQRGVQHREHARRAARRARSSPATYASIRATWTPRFARAAKIVEATYSTPYLPRARMEPGNATVLVTDDRVDIWIGDQSPQEDALQRVEDHRHSRAERLSAPVPSRRRLRPQRQRSAGRAGDHDRERESRHADPSAVDARGGLHRHDLSRDGHGAPEGRSRRRRLADRARGAHGDAGRRLRPGGVVRRGVALLRAELSLLEPHDEVSRAGRHAARHRAGRARVLSRELHERARARRRQGSVSLSARAHCPHQPAVQGRHDQGARHGRRDVGLGQAAAEGHGARDRARGARRGNQSAWRRSARWCTPFR